VVICLQRGALRRAFRMVEGFEIIASITFIHKHFILIDKSSSECRRDPRALDTTRSANVVI
jgi:hypothetical protein